MYDRFECKRGLNGESLVMFTLGALRVRFSLGTNVNTHFHQVFTPTFGPSASAQVQGLDLAGTSAWAQGMKTT